MNSNINVVKNKKKLTVKNLPVKDFMIAMPDQCNINFFVKSLQEYLKKHCIKINIPTGKLMNIQDSIIFTGKWSDEHINIIKNFAEIYVEGFKNGQNNCINS